MIFFLFYTQSFLKTIKRSLTFLFLLTAILANAQDSAPPVKIAIVGLTHGHARLVFRFLDSDKVKIVGITEPNKTLVNRFKKKHNLSDSLFFNTIEDVLLFSKPDGVAVFTSTKQHLEVVEKCALKGIDVMVEKPIAVNLKDAETMQQLAIKHNINVVTNYETTWHPSVIEAQKIVFEKNSIGKLRKIIFHHGNNGTTRGRGADYFFEWLTDPIKNGGGAIMDFGCYGANITTWLNKGEKPVSVYAVTNQYKPELYPKVDDDALIVLEYPEYQSILMASWNWAIPRKDIEIYGSKGFVKVEDSEHLNYSYLPDKKNIKESFNAIGYPINEPFGFFADVIRGKKIEPFSQASIENNLIVMEILDAARKSAKTGKKVNFK